MYDYDPKTRTLRGTMFRMVTRGAVQRTEFEWAMRQPENMAPLPVDNICLWGGSADKLWPIYVGERSWKKALDDSQRVNDLWKRGLDDRQAAKTLAETLAQVNLLQPGCIYQDKRILAEIVRRTAIATYSADEGRLSDAQVWLRKVCVPYGKDKGRAKILPAQLGYFDMLLMNVTLIHSVFRKTRSSHETLRIFPELAGLLERDRKGTVFQWPDLCMRSEPMQASCEIMANAMGYKKGRTVSQTMSPDKRRYFRSPAFRAVNRYWLNRIFP